MALSQPKTQAKFQKLVFWGYAMGDFPNDAWNKIKNISQNYVLIARNDEAELKKQLIDADGLLVKFGLDVTPALIDTAPRLRYIGILATGYGRIDAAYATRKNIFVANIPGYSTQAVAEFTFGILLEHLRQLEKSLQLPRQGSYDVPDFNGPEICGKVFGVIGLGDIGSNIAKIAAHGFGAKVLYWSRTPKAHMHDAMTAYAPLDQVLEQADFISLNLAHNAETDRFLDQARLQRLKKGAVLINLSPMELIDRPALLNRLRQNDMSLLLDHTDEMPVDYVQELLQLGNVRIYPPNAFNTPESALRKNEIFVQNLLCFLNNKPQNKAN